MLLAVALALSAAMSPTTTRFDVGGLTVILRTNHASNVVAANLYLLGGTRQVTPEIAGIEPILLDVSERGTLHYPKAEMRRRMALLGSEIVVRATVDWTMLGIRTSSQVFDSTWSILADRVMHPVLDPSDVDLVRSQYVISIQQQNDDPDSRVSRIADSIAFGAHAYSVPIGGSLQSVSAITAQTLLDYADKQFVTSRMLLVVVGDVDSSQVARLVASTLAMLPHGDYHWTLPGRLPEGTSTVAMESRHLPTNYILGYFSGPLPNTNDYQPLRIASSVLTGRMFAEIRTRRNLTYEVHSPFLDRAATSGGLYISTVDPDSALRLMKASIRELQTEILDADGLQQLILQFITQYFMDNETNAAQADFLARSFLYRGDYRAADRFVDELRGVTPEDVQRVARRYMREIRFGYLGDTTRVTRSLFGQF